MYAYSAGIIPYNRELGFLLGNERHGWAPFSGKSEHGETVFGTALREFHEESCNVFQDVSLADVLDEVHGKTPRGRPFYMFVANFPPLHREEQFIKARDVCDTYAMMEKTEIRWFTPVELESNNFHYRSCFTSEIPRLLSFWRSQNVTVEPGLGAQAQAQAQAQAHEQPEEEPGLVPG
jgi:ADP-ribose pyrophosphatase YjhB (NUDIX family)